MADVAGDLGVPSVDPEISAPNVMQNVEPKAAAGLGDLGAGATTLGKVFGQVQTDQVTNNANDAARALTLQYRQMGGADALNAQATYQQQLEKIYSDAKGQLGALDQQVQFSDNARRYQNMYAEDMDSHAAEMGQQHAKQVTAQTIQGGLDQISSNTSDASFKAGMNQILSGVTKGMQLDGNAGDPILFPAAIKNAQAQAWQYRIKTEVVTNLPQALQWAQQNQALLGADYASVADPLTRQVRASTSLAATDSIADAAVGGFGSNAGAAPPTGPAVPITPQSVTAAIIGQESGGNPNASTSVTGAIGGAQMEPATFKEFALPGESINNPADNLAVAQRAITHYLTEFGNDPQRAAVAYFSGPGNVAPLGSPTPWIQDRADPNGKTVLSYVGDFSARLGLPAPAGGGAAGTEAAQTSVDQIGANITQIADNAANQAEQQYPDIPGIGDITRQKVMARYALMRQQQTDSQTANLDTVSNFINSNQINSASQLSGAPQPVMAAWSNLTGDQQKSALEMMNQNIPGNRTPDSPDAQKAVAYFTGLSTLSPKNFLNVNFQSPQMLQILTTEQRAAMMAKQNDIIKGVVSGPASSQINDAITQAKPILASAGIFPGDSPIWQTGNVSFTRKQQNQQEYTQAVGQLTNDITDFQKQNDRPPNATETQQMVQRLLIKGTVAGKPTTLFQAESGGKIDPNFLPDIPTPDLTAINRVFYQNYGRYPNQNEAAMIYMSAQGVSSPPGFLVQQTGDVASDLPGGENLTGNSPAVIPMKQQSQPSGRVLTRGDVAWNSPQ